MSHGIMPMNDHTDHMSHIHQPDPEPNRFNNHVHPAIPHLQEQLEHDHEVHIAYMVLTLHSTYYVFCEK